MIGCLKAGPTTWVMQFKAGRLKREGAGLSFFFWVPTTTLVMVPISSSDVPFAFTEVTQDFQTVTVQGQLTWKVADPKKLAGLLDFSVDRRGAPLSDDPAKLVERLVHATQVLTRAVTGSLTLKQVLVGSAGLESQVLASLRESSAVAMLGVEILSLSMLSVRPTPEMARALEAEAREALQRRSDEAIHERRKAAVEQERRIKESELLTDVMVEEKRRHIRETKMAADIALEQQRAELIDQSVANDNKAADSKAYALKASLEPIRELDWKTLTALGSGGGDPRAMIGLAFRELAENAQRIGELNISPDLLRSLIGEPGSAVASAPEPAAPRPRSGR